MWLQQRAAEKNLTYYYHMKPPKSSAMRKISIAAHVLETEALRTCLSLWYNYMYNPALHGHYFVRTGFFVTCRRHSSLRLTFMQ